MKVGSKAILAKGNLFTQTHPPGGREGSKMLRRRIKHASHVETPLASECDPLSFRLT